MNPSLQLDHEHPLPASDMPAGRTRGLGPIAALFGPVTAPRGSFERRLLLIRSIVAYVGTLATLVQVVVWLLIGLLTGRLDTPWWLWTAVPAAAAVAALGAAQRWRDWWTAASSGQESAR